MNLSAYSVEQLQEAHRVLTERCEVPAVLRHLDEGLCNEIEIRSSRLKQAYVDRIQEDLRTLNRCAVTDDMDDEILVQARGALRTAVEVLCPVRG